MDPASRTSTERITAVALLSSTLASIPACRPRSDAPEAARPAYTMEELRERLYVGKPRLSLPSVEAGGLQFLELACAVPPDEIPGAMETVDALAKHKPVLDLCSPGGSLAVLTWIGSPDGPTDLRAFTTLGPEVDACVEAALASAVTPTTGRCATAVLFGDDAGAQTAKRAFETISDDA